MAKLLANGMEEGLKQRITCLRKLRDNDSSKALPALLRDEAAGRRKGAAAPAALVDKARAWMKTAADDSATQMKFSGLSIADADGFIVMRGYWTETHPWSPLPGDEVIWADNCRGATGSAGTGASSAAADTRPSPRRTSHNPSCRRKRGAASSWT